MRSIERIIHEWAVRCFGLGHVLNSRVRALRTAEEAIELAQAFGVAKDQLHTLIDTIYERPIGDRYQEIGGLLMTVSVLCSAHGWSLDEVLEHELRRVLAKPAKHFTDRNLEKMDAGFA